MKNINWSTYSLEIFDAVKNGNQNIFINAVAGAGKTTNLINIIENVIPEKQKILVLCFNRNIADHISHLLNSKRNVEVNTFHSIGLDCIRKKFRGVTIDNRKYIKYFEAIAKRKANKIIDKDVLVDELIRAYELKRLRNEDIINDLEFDFEYINYWDDLDEIFKGADHYGMENMKTITFSDMIYYPFKMGLRYSTADYLVVDEAQDLSNLLINLVEINGENARKIFAGDKFQAIYGFAGSSTRAVDDIIEKFNCSVKSLPVTYRCPISHVELAKKIVPYIECAPGAIEGEIERISYNDFVNHYENLVSDKESTLIISRNNSELIKLGLEMAKKGIYLKIRGNGIEKSLLGLFKFLFRDGIIDLNKIKEYKEKNSKSRNFQKVEKAECIENILCERNYVKNYNDFKKVLNNLFEESNQKIILSTIHRSKGLEGEHVIFIKENLIPHPKASGEILEQEYNLKYIGLTRSKRKLTFVS